MLQVSSIFITVTTTVTGTPLPTLNATQIQQLNAAKHTGEIIAFTSLGIFGFLGLILLICWGILRQRRPPPPPVVENPDAVRHGRGAFLPIIGNKLRKSTPNIEAGGVSNPGSTQTLIGHGAPKARRLSMWADDSSPYAPPIPSPPPSAAHSRTSSARSVEQFESRHQRAKSSASTNSIASVTSQYHGAETRDYDEESLNFVPLQSALAPPVPPKIGHVNRLPKVEVSRFSFEQAQGLSPVVSPLEPTSAGISRYSSNNGVGPYDRVMYG